MSAIIDPVDKSTQQGGEVGPDGVRRYHTRCWARVDSHNAGAGQESKHISLVEDIISVQLSKTIKGPGQANITLLPSQNYLNLIFPNDYINIYFDIGDGQSWTRSFFGFVDRIEETYQVDSEGKPTTRYTLVCTDFFKAFDHTMIYFNPHLSGRTDFAGVSFAAPNLGGVALASSGIQAAGSPSDIVQNLIMLMMGFGSQFLMPPTYQPALQNLIRNRRRDFVLGRVSDATREAIEQAGGSFEQLREQELNRARGIIGSSENVPLDEFTRRAAAANGLTAAEIDSATNTEQLAALLSDRNIRERFRPTNDANQVGNFSQENLNLFRSVTAEDPSLLDVIDIFTFVEREAIDGYVSDSTIWQQQGTLLSILQSFSNEAMNELIFDLRPVSLDNDGNFSLGVAGSSDPQTGYARIKDDVGGNEGPDGNDPLGITHVPAVVMREYPFSVIDGVDLRGVPLNLRGSGGTIASVGILFFGAIFSDRPNEPGRHLVKIPNINMEDRDLGSPITEAIKHLDVAVIRDTEVMSTQLGRSDNDHFNLFEFYSDALLGNDQRFYMSDLLPIITPIHIIRNGLRVRTITTRFARFDLGIANRSDSSTAENTGPTPAPSTEPVTPGNVIAPVTKADNAAVGFGDRSTGRWGYRVRTDLTSGNPFWIFHNGIDIGGVSGVPIKCIADGEVVISAPNGVHNGVENRRKGYGNIIVIKHQFEGVEGPRYSVYAHLNSRAVGWDLGRAEGTRSEKAYFAAVGAPGIPGTPQQQPIPITKGTVIGTMGRSGVETSGVHLHFEIDKNFPPKNDNVTPRVAADAEHPNTPATRTGLMNGLHFDSTGINPSANQNSANAVDFYQAAFGMDLVPIINQDAVVSTEEEDAHANQSDEQDVSNPEDQNRPRDVVLAENNAQPLPRQTGQITTSSTVDSAISRSQITRWALLQDHWYQHNLEYLAGRIDMRGAPEIRVGYRLDMPDRYMSFYVEGVNHAWQFPGQMQTSLQVTRGQPSKPYPAYVLPKIEAFTPTTNQRRTSQSRLATYFVTPDPIAVRRSVVLRGAGLVGGVTRISSGVNSDNASIDYLNDIDNIAIDGAGIDTGYDEKMLPAGSFEARIALEQSQADSELDAIVIANNENLQQINTITNTTPDALLNPQNPSTTLVG